ncbi:MAG: nuclear transport factor 2 family protein [Betaproteobacteria bacterium]
MKTLLILLAAGMAVLSGPAFGSEGKRQEENKRVVLAFYEKGINQKDFGAASPYLGPRYIQHNQRAADGVEGFRAFIKFLREQYPASRSEIKRVFADGDYVILHVHAVRVPGTRGLAVVDIFRLENGKIVEHWDVHEEILEKAANENGMF